MFLVVVLVLFLFIGLYAEVFIRTATLQTLISNTGPFVQVYLYKSTCTSTGVLVALNFNITALYCFTILLLNFFIFFFYSTVYLLYCFFGRLPESQRAHEWASDLVSRADLVCNLHHFSNRIRARGCRGPRRPRRAENRQRNHSTARISTKQQGLSRSEQNPPKVGVRTYS